jgi:hypothetical protein
MPKNSVFSCIRTSIPFFSEEQFTNWFNDLRKYLIEKDEKYTLRYNPSVNEEDYYTSQPLDLADTVNNPALMYFLFHNNYFLEPINDDTSTVSEIMPENTLIQQNTRVLHFAEGNTS